MADYHYLPKSVPALLPTPSDQEFLPVVLKLTNGQSYAVNPRASAKDEYSSLGDLVRKRVHKLQEESNEATFGTIISALKLHGITRE